MPELPSLFITGTDTGVGKTVVTGILAWVYQEAGLRVGIEKPVVTGAETTREGVVASDLLFLEKVLPAAAPPVNSYHFPQPVSPHLAAAMSGVSMDPARIEGDHQALSAERDAVLVEGAGGLLVPLRDDFFMADLALCLRLPVIVVSRPSLGTINHTLLTVFCARAKGLTVAGIVVNNYPDAPGPAERDNPAAIERLAGVPVLAIVPHIPGLCVEEAEIGELGKTARAVDEKFHMLDRLSVWRKKHV